MKKLLVIAALATIAPLMAQAESKFVTGNGAANANLDFSITIPQVLFLQVGTGSSLSDNGAVNKITFDVPAGSVGNSAQVAGLGGDLLLNGGVTVRVLGNAGNVTLDNRTTGPLSNGVIGDPTVPWSDILVTASALPSTTAGFSNSAIAHPPFNTGAGTSPTPTNLTATGRVVRQEGSWTFAYANTATLPAGTYGDTAAKNGRVVYTATTP